VAVERIGEGLRFSGAIRDCAISTSVRPSLPGRRCAGSARSRSRFRRAAVSKESVRRHRPVALLFHLEAPEQPGFRRSRVAAFAPASRDERLGGAKRSAGATRQPQKIPERTGGSASDFEFSTACGTLPRVQYELLVGWRYTRAKRRNHFISFISIVSMFGIALGVWALITVLSVMNGFQKELRARILASLRTCRSPG